MTKPYKYRFHGVEEVRKDKYRVNIALSHINYTSEARETFNKNTAQYLRDALLLVLKDIYNTKTDNAHQTTARKYILNKLELIHPGTVLPKSFFDYANLIYRKAHSHEIIPNSMSKALAASDLGEGWDELGDPIVDLLDLEGLEQTIIKDSISTPSQSSYTPSFSSSNPGTSLKQVTVPALDLRTDLLSATACPVKQEGRNNHEHSFHKLRNGKRYCQRL